MHGTGTAMLSWVIDQVALGGGSLGGGPVDLSAFTPIGAAELAGLLVPTYATCVPQLDAWGFPYDYWLDTADLLGPELLAIRSRGSDGVASGDVYLPGTFPATEYHQDIVWADLAWVRSPDLGLVVFVDGFEDGDTCGWGE